MIKQFLQITGVPYDLVVVGSGPAGCTIADQLAELGFKILLLEGGNSDISAESQELYEGHIIGDEYDPLDVVRLRYFGGTSNHWTGQCSPFPPDEFGEVLSADELKMHEDIACQILELAPKFKEKNISQDFRQIQFKWSTPVRFHEKYLEKFSRSQHIDIVFDANVTSLIGSSGRISDLELYVGDAPIKQTLPVKNVVVCCGGLENSRILLHSQTKNGELFDLPELGKGWSDHYVLELGEVLGNGRKYRKLFDEDLKKEGATFLAPTRDLAENLDFCGYLTLTPGRGKQLRNLVQDLACFNQDMANFISKLTYENVCHDSLSVCWESAGAMNIGEKPASKIVLHQKDLDKFEVPRLVLDHQIAGLPNALNFVERFGKWLLSNNAGFLGMKKFQTIEEMKENIRFGYHHCGGTAISVDKTDGVVDKNLKIHGLDNAWVAGSSVFWKAGSRYPTFQIVQLAARFAQHFSEVAKR